MEKDRVTESYDWVYGWKVEDGKCVPPAKKHPSLNLFKSALIGFQMKFREGCLHSAVLSKCC